MKDRIFWSEAHVFDVEGKQILFDVLGGRFFEVDSLTREVAQAQGLQSVGGIVSALGSRYAPGEVASAVEELEQAEVLTRAPVQVAPFHPPSRLEITHLSVCLTRDEVGNDARVSPPLQAHRTEGTGQVEGDGTGPRGKGRSRGRTRGSVYMSEAVGLAAVDFLIQASGCLRDCAITFEGGEPLLNLSLLRRIVSHAEERAGQTG